MKYTYDFTTDDSLLNDYFSLRKEIYTEEFGDPVPIDQFDIKSHHLIIKDQHNNVVGGARITPKAPGNLPMEAFGVNLTNFDFTSKVCEIGRVAVKKEHRSFDVLTNIFKSIGDKCKEEQTQTILIVGHPKNVRLDSIMCKKNNVNYEVINEVPLHDPFFINHLGAVNLLKININ